MEGPPVRFLLALCLLAAAHAGAEIYRWTDADGHIHYSDKPPAGASTKQVKVRINSIAGPAVVTPAPGSTKPSSSARAAVKMFTASWCGYCKKAKAHLNARGVPFQEIDVESSDSARRQFSELGGRGVPVILVGGQRMDGFDAGGLDAMLAAGGY
jgi:glutaredoxin